MINNKRLFVGLAIASFLLLLSALFSLIKEPAPLTPEEGGWATENQSKLISSALSEYLNQDQTESREKRNKRLQKYFSEDSPVFEYGTTEIDNSGFNKSKGRLIEAKDCHEQEGEGLCLIANMEIDYYSGKEKIKTETVTYWARTQYDKGVGFRVYDLGPWGFNYDDELF